MRLPHPMAWILAGALWVGIYEALARGLDAFGQAIAVLAFQ